MLLPVPAAVPPHDPVYHFAAAPVPAVPPNNVSVVLPPGHIAVVPIMLKGATELVFTVTVALAHAVVLHVPSYLT